jgi:hypothetical protein
MQLPVHVHHELDVDYEVVNIRKSARDEVVWYSEGDELTIQFEPESSPFANESFVVPAGGSASSGPVRQDAVIARYHYSIRSNASLAMTADPDVDIKR